MTIFDSKNKKKLKFRKQEDGQKGSCSNFPLQKHAKTNFFVFPQGPTQTRGIAKKRDESEEEEEEEVIPFFSSFFFGVFDFVFLFAFSLCCV